MTFNTAVLKLTITGLVLALVGCGGGGGSSRGDTPNPPPPPPSTSSTFSVSLDSVDAIDRASGSGVTVTGGAVSGATATIP